MAQRSIKLTNKEINDIASIIANSMLKVGSAKIAALGNLSGEAAAEKFATVFANEIKSVAVNSPSETVQEVKKLVIGDKAVQKYMQDHKISAISNADEALIEKAMGNIRADIYKAYKSTADDAFVNKFTQITSFQAVEEQVEEQAEEQVEEQAEEAVSNIDFHSHPIMQDSSFSLVQNIDASQTDPIIFVH